MTIACRQDGVAMWNQNGNQYVKVNINSPSNLSNYHKFSMVLPVPVILVAAKISPVTWCRGHAPLTLTSAQFFQVCILELQQYNIVFIFKLIHSTSYAEAKSTA